MFIKKDFIKPNSIELRQYQLNIVKSAEKENTLIVLPTGMGKTIIALMLITKFLTNEENKILFLAPTKPLVTQHMQFLNNFLTLEKEKIQVFTGETSPEKRIQLWTEKRIIVSTPQVIENDLLSKRYNLKDVALIIFDECHHAVGNYAYVFVAETYKRQREQTHVLGMTASPGNDISKIIEVCKNLNFTNIEIRTKYDADVKPYVHNLNIIWREVTIPNDFDFDVKLLKKALSERLKLLKDMNLIDSSSVSLINRTKLLEAQKKIQSEIKASLKPPKILFKAASVQSEAMKLHYALEMLQTQGINAFLNYFSRIGKEVSTKNSTKASRKIVSDPDVLEAVAHAKTIDVEHPKVDEISKIVNNQLIEKPDSKIIVFTHFRDTSAYICNSLENVKKARPARFIGQSIKEGDKGLTQKEQARIIEQFKKGVVNVLIATSVAEEGLDIPATDLVVFYEPIPSEIRAIQRRGRTGRVSSGKVIILITKGTSDVGYYWAAKRKEKRMRSELELLRSKLKKKFEDPQAFYKKEMGPQINQKTLSDYQKNKDQIKIIVDHREYRSSVVKNLSTKGTDVEPQQLDVGDYVLSSRIGVERKNVDDYLDSLLSGKLFKQVVQLRNAYSRPILIIEGGDLYTKRNINHNAIFGSLASISVDYGVSILTTKDSGETADLLHVIAKREQREDKKAVAVRGEKPLMSVRERQQFIIEGLPNVSAVIAKRLLSHFGSIKDIANASEEELQQIKGVGKNIALDIINLLNTNYLED